MTSNFLEYLEESLNTPVDFYMTDDTVLPKSVFAAFTIDDTDYGMSLVESNLKKVYILKIYRIVNGKPRNWNFAKRSHLRPAFSTLLKFAEACVPFVKTHMDGVLIEISKKLASERFNAFGRMMIDRLYVKSFRSVPVSVNADKKEVKKEYYHYLFFARKSVNPSSVFTQKAFKHYEFDKAGVIPLEMAADIAPKKVQKPTVTLDQSKKYSFGQFAVELDDIKDPDYFANLEKNSKPISGEEPQADASAANKAKAQKAAHDEAVKAKDAAVNGSIASMAKNLTDPQLVSLMFPVGVKKVFEKGYDPNAFNKDNANHVLSQLMGQVPLLKPVLTEKGWTNSAGKLTDKGSKAVQATLKSFGDGSDSLTNVINHGENTKNLMAAFDVEIKNLDKEIEKTKPNVSVEPGKNVTTIESSINPTELPYSIPGSHPLTTKENGFVYEGENSSDLQKRNYIQDDLGYYEEISNLPSTVYQAIRTYTGSASSSYNEPLREAAKNYLGGDTLSDTMFDKYKQDIAGAGKIHRLAKAFDVLKPLSEPLWVYRGAYTDPKSSDNIIVGNEYVDPGFMSTSIKASNTFGMQNLRLAIYLPAGTRCVPVLNHSKHEHEMEIILPPMSMMKVIKASHEVSEYNSEKVTTHATVMYMGSAYKSIKEQAKSDVKATKSIKEMMRASVRKEIMTEAKKPIKPAGKWGGKIDPNISKNMSKLVKSGKVKLDTKKK